MGIVALSQRSGKASNPQWVWGLIARGKIRTEFSAQDIRITGGVNAWSADRNVLRRSRFSVTR